jgi:hypothetical protein
LRFAPPSGIGYPAVGVKGPSPRVGPVKLNIPDGGTYLSLTGSGSGRSRRSASFFTTFTWQRREAMSSRRDFLMPPDVKGVLRATSFCNVHDFWLTEFTVS